MKSCFIHFLRNIQTYKKEAVPMDLNQKLVSIDRSEAVVLRDLFGKDKTFVALVRHLG
jgi:hypothetical protein